MSKPNELPVLQGAGNFRDLGGYLSTYGGRVRFGRVYRSETLGALTPEDSLRLQALALTHSIDFRGVTEREASPYQIAQLEVLSLPIEPTVVQRLRSSLASGIIPTTEEAVEMMCETYRGFVNENALTFARFLRHLLKHPTPVVFHCTAGKDRTGFAAALLLSILGIESETIMQDYLLSNKLYQRIPKDEGSEIAHVMDVIWRVQPEFLHAAYREIDRSYGSVKGYLQDAAGMQEDELHQLRRIMLV